MTNALTPTGLTVDDVNDVVAELTTGMQTIYGADINVDPNSPDGQLINIFAQAVADMLELLVNVYDSFSVDGAFGTNLDQRVALNGIARRQGTFTTTPVTITVNQALTLYGLDQTVNIPFTISDSAGNQYQLLLTHVFSGGGSASLTFQAVTIGAVTPTANTITNQVTSTLGVTNVNNPTITGTTVGVNEETDVQLKIRHAQSFALASTGPADAIQAALTAIPDVTDAYVVENVTDSPVTYGPYTVPAHSIWCIVTGGTDAEIGQAIYAKKAPGCGMLGANSFIVTRPNGTTFTAQWDTSIGQPLYISFTVLWRGPTLLSTTSIETALAQALSYKLGQSPNIGDVVQAMLIIAPTAIVTLSSNQGVSTDGSTYESIVNPDTPINYFTVNVANISVS